MKKTLVILGICSFILACNSAENSGDTKNTITATETKLSTGLSNAEQLISNSDCLTCHKVDTKLVGPAYRDIANKYEDNEANTAMLVGKIINGGLGSWGEIPMAPHPALSTDDATEMVHYILSLKTK